MGKSSFYGLTLTAAAIIAGIALAQAPFSYNKAHASCMIGAPGSEEQVPAGGGTGTFLGASGQPATVDLASQPISMCADFMSADTDVQPQVAPVKAKNTVPAIWLAAKHKSHAYNHKQLK